MIIKLIGVATLFTAGSILVAGRESIGLVAMHGTSMGRDPWQERAGVQKDVVLMLSRFTGPAGFAGTFRPFQAAMPFRPPARRPGCHPRSG